MNSIHLKTTYCDNELPLCASKFWGNPDLPSSYDFPTYTDSEGEESHYDFVCQIRCAELAPFDKENRLPHQGMLYFFAQIGYHLGDIFFSEPLKSGLLPKDKVKVFYYPKEDWEDYQSVVLLDEEDEETAFREQKIEFSASKSEDGANHKLIGSPDLKSEEINPAEYSLLFQLDSCELEEEVELNFLDGGMLYFLQPIADIGKTFKNIQGYLAVK